MAVMEQWTEAVRDLHEELHDVITTSGRPIWETCGSGTGLPSRRLRVEFRKHWGVSEDDWRNTRWAELFHRLPKYQLKECYGEVRHEKTEGNCMEMVVGLSYACFTGGRRLPDTARLHFARQDAFEGWAGLWPKFQALGINATIVTAVQAPAPFAPSPKAAPASAASTLEWLTQATVDLAHVAPAECRGQLGGGRGFAGCRCRAPLLAFRIPCILFGRMGR